MACGNNGAGRLQPTYISCGSKKNVFANTFKQRTILNTKYINTNGITAKSIKTLNSDNTIMIPSGTLLQNDIIVVN